LLEKMRAAGVCWGRGGGGGLHGRARREGGRERAERLGTAFFTGKKFVCRTHVESPRCRTHVETRWSMRVARRRKRPNLNNYYSFFMLPILTHTQWIISFVLGFIHTQSIICALPTPYPPHFFNEYLFSTHTLPI
jgi:hypothetical protein